MPCSRVLTTVPLPQRSCRIRKSCNSFGDRVPFCHLVIQNAMSPPQRTEVRVQSFPDNSNLRPVG